MLQLAFVNFKQNSFILIEGTPATDRFFIIQSGKVKCYHESPFAGGTQGILGPGDFIGVIPCMSGHTQTENVVAVTDVVAIMVRKEQYSELIMHNTPIAMKIVRSFARDMRILNDNLTKITVKKVALESAEGIYDIAEYYESKGYPDIAIYGYYQYLKECPQGTNIEDAKRKFLGLKSKSRAVYFEPSKEMVRSYPRDTMVFSEFQHGADMFIIQEGSVRITKVVDNKEVILAVLKKGDMFGEMALLENKPRSASAVAVEPCKLMTVNRANFDQMVATQPAMISRLTTMLADRLWAMHRQLANTQLRNPRERMIDMLALQIEKQRVQPVKGVAYKTGISVTDLFNLCGIETAVQEVAYTQLSSDQNVKIMDGRITVPDVTELIKQATFYRKQNNKHSNS